MNLKKNRKALTSKSVGTGPSYYEKRIYRAAVSQRLRNTGLDLYSWQSIVICVCVCVCVCVRARVRSHSSAHGRKLQKVAECVSETTNVPSCTNHSF